MSLKYCAVVTGGGGTSSLCCGLLSLAYLASFRPGAKIRLMILFFIFKLLVVLFFLVMFLRGSRLVWGVGLLTVTTAFLLDTFLGTFGREQMVAELGFFYYVISGGIFAGAALWLFGLLRPVSVSSPATATAYRTPAPVPVVAAPRPVVNTPAGGNTAFDRQMLYEQIRDRLGPADVLDVAFDLGINENEIYVPGEEMQHTIIRMMDLAEARGQTGSLAVAVERILTPLPAENLPRLEKMSVQSPPAVLRQYLLAHYDVAGLREMAGRLGIDWEQLDYANKRSLARSLLLYLYRRNRVEELIGLLREEVTEGADEGE